MSDSLRDQLLKSGLVKKLKAEATPAPKPSFGGNRLDGGKRHDGGKHQDRSQRHDGRRHDGGKPAQRPVPPTPPAPHEHDLARAYALRAKQEKEDREHAQREAERAAREKKERKQKLTDLLAGKALNAADADVPRHFPHGSKIRRIYVTAEQLARLNRGELAVVQLAGRYLLVERDVALQAQAVHGEALVLLCDPNAPAEDDVPADIVW